MKPLIALTAMLHLAASHASAKESIVYQGTAGPGVGKHIVFVTGDEEYRSEEAGVVMARILALHHGFKCTVLFAIDPSDGTINPQVLDNIPGLEALDSADLCVVNLRFRELPDAQMKHFVDYVNSGKPLIGLRTATHAFNYVKNKQSPYAKYSCTSKDWPGGFGRQVLGETWVNHHGLHGSQSTRGIVNDTFKDHPILRGVNDIWGPTDVYTVSHLGQDAKVLVWGQVLSGMHPTDPPLKDDPEKKNDPMMPVVWTRSYTGESGKTSTIVTTTMGAAIDLESAGLRRLLVNSCYWLLGLGDQISPTSDVSPVGEFKPLNFGFGEHRKGVKPEDLEL